LSQKVDPFGQDPGPDKVGQKTKTALFMTSATKKQNPKLTKVFDLIYQTCRILRGFEQLTSSIAWRVMTYQTWPNRGT